MRIGRAIAYTAIGLVTAGAAAFAGLQTGIGQRWLFGMVASAASSPDMQVRISGPHGYFPMRLTLDRIEVADRRGVWLQVDQAHVDWSFLSLFNDKLRIERLTARRVDLIRQPDPPQEPAKPSSGSFGLPIGVELKTLAVDEIRLRAPAVPVESQWRLSGTAAVAADTGQSDAKMLLDRIDGRSGKLELDAHYDLKRRTVATTISLQEGEAGLVASLVGRPDLKAVSARLVANGDARQGNAELTFDGGDAMNSRGSLTWKPTGAATDVALKFEAAAPGLADGPLARVVRKPIVIVGNATIDQTSIDLRDFTLTGEPLRLKGAVKYGVADHALDGQISVVAGDPGGLKDILGGVTWHDLSLDLRVSGTTLVPKLTARAKVADVTGPDGLTARDVDITVDGDARDIGNRTQANLSLKGSVADVGLPAAGGRPLPSARLDFNAKGALRPDGRITIDAAELASAFASIKAAGVVQPSMRDGEVRATLTVSDAATISTIAGRPITGRGAIDVTARVASGAASVEWRGALENLAVEGVPNDLLKAGVKLSGKAGAQQDQSWNFDAVRIESDALVLEASGRGRGRDGDVDLSLSAPRLAALGQGVDGKVSVKSTIGLRADGIALKLTADAQDLAHETLRAGRLALQLDATLKGDAISGALNAKGDLAGQPLTVDGRFARAANGEISVPSIDARWASTTIEARTLTITQTMATGSAQVRIGDLAEIGHVIGSPLAGSLDVDVTTDNEAAQGRVKIALHGKALSAGGIGAASVESNATVVDPLGRAAIEAMLRATGLRGIDEISQATLTVGGEKAALDVTAQASGPRTNAQLAAKVSQVAEGFLVELARATGRFADLPIALSGASRLHIAGSRVVVEPTALRIADGRVSIAGTVDPLASDLSIDIAAFPLAAIGKIAPGVDMTGALQTKTRIRGALSAPAIESSFTVSAMRLRQPATELLPAVSITGTAGMSGNRATFDTQISAGAGGRLTVKGDAAVAGAAINATVRGTLDLAPFAPLIGSTVQGLRGTAVPDLTLRVAGGAITGQGSVTVNGIAMTLPVAGLRLQGGEALVRLQGNALTIERLRASTGGSGEVNASGSLRLDAAQGFPVDLQVTTRRAALVNRPDLVATISSNLKVTGAATNGLTVTGPVTVDRAELTIGASQVANYPTLPVREINKPGVANQPPPPTPVVAGKPVPTGPPRGAPVTLAISVNAPSAVFVRGRGLDAEVGGRVEVSGSATSPSVTGALSLRRGEFNLAGKRLKFTRGNVTLVDLETIEPYLDFLASTPFDNGTIEISITGNSRAPKIELHSTPELPPDEVMATLLFGKPGAKLSPFELLQAAQALAELTGTGQNRGVLARLRGGLGLDRLGVDSKGQDPASITVEAGRYVAPGVYVGAKQGATADSSRGVVEIDVFKNTKVEADFGADSTGRLGIKMEWDY